MELSAVGWTSPGMLSSTMEGTPTHTEGMFYQFKMMLHPHLWQMAASSALTRKSSRMYVAILLRFEPRARVLTAGQVKKLITNLPYPHDIPDLHGRSLIYCVQYPEVRVNTFATGDSDESYIMFDTVSRALMDVYGEGN